jgi:electron transfer flavoprotein alpha subunit
MNSSFAVLCPFGLDAGLLTKAVTLAQNAAVRVLVPRRDTRQAAAFGATQIHTLPDDYSGEDEAAFALWLAEKINTWRSTVVLAPATVQLRGIMPLLASRLHAGLTADCTALAMDGDQLIQTRPAFGNSLMADIRTVSPVQLATVRPGTFRAQEAPVKNPVITPETPLPATRVRLLEFTPFEEGAPLSQASVILAGGLGIGSRAGFEKLEKLAQRLGGSVAASRSAVDAGFAPYRCQVGITGVTVCPKVYVAIGISGAVQHLSGMSGAQTVIAINSDPKAPIFDYADYGIVGDWETVIDQVLEELS